MNKNLRKILICAFTIVVVICTIFVLTSTRHLAKLTSGDITIDVSEHFDINAYLTNVKEGTEVSYKLDKENSHLTVNLVNGKKSETLEKDVTIIYPRVDIPEDITIDTFVGYDINQIVDCDSDVKVTSELNKEAGELTITYSKGEYTNTVVKKVNVTSSDPRDNARFYDCKNIRDVEYQMIVYPDGTLEELELTTGNVYAGQWEMTDNNNGEMFKMINSPSWWRIGLYFSDDSKEASFFVGNDKRGGADRDYCELTKIEPYDESMKLYQ